MQRRRFFQPIRHTATASAMVGTNGLELGRVTAACVLTFMVSCVATAKLPEGVTVVGLKEHVALPGSPEHAKLTTELKPFCGVTVRVVDPCEPE